MRRCPKCKKDVEMVASAALFGIFHGPEGACAECKHIFHTMYSRCDPDAGPCNCDDGWRDMIFGTKTYKKRKAGVRKETAG